jgi:hypothetical protein
MKPSIIVYGVPNGKTRFAERIAKFYGLKNGGSFSMNKLCSRDFVYFVDGPFNTLMGGIQVKSFSEVADEINAAIPLTDWSQDLPSVKGVFQTDDSNGHAWSYWDGKKFCYRGFIDCGQTPNHAYDMRLIETALPEITKWRGLSEEPIVID